MFIDFLIGFLISGLIIFVLWTLVNKKYPLMMKTTDTLFVVNFVVLFSSFSTSLIFSLLDFLINFYSNF